MLVCRVAVGCMLCRKQEAHRIETKQIHADSDVVSKLLLLFVHGFRDGFFVFHIYYYCHLYMSASVLLFWVLMAKICGWRANLLYMLPDLEQSLHVSATFLGQQIRCRTSWIHGKDDLGPFKQICWDNDSLIYHCFLLHFLNYLSAARYDVWLLLHYSICRWNFLRPQNESSNSKFIQPFQIYLLNQKKVSR